MTDDLVVRLRRTGVVSRTLDGMCDVRETDPFSVGRARATCGNEATALSLRRRSASLV